MWNYATDQNIDDVDLPAEDNQLGWAEYLPQTVYAMAMYHSALDHLTAKAAVEWVLKQLEKGGGDDD